MKLPLLLIGLLLCGCTPAAPSTAPSNAVTFEEEPDGSFCEEATVNVNERSRKTWNKNEPKPNIECWVPSENYGDHCKVTGYGRCTKFVTRPRRCFINFPTGVRYEVDCPPLEP